MRRLAYSLEPTNTDLGQLGVVEQVRPVSVYESAEGKSVPPAAMVGIVRSSQDPEAMLCCTSLLPQMEVLDVDVLVWRRLPLAPEQQALLSGHLLHRYVLDGKTKNDRPDHAQGHLDVAVDNF